MLSRPGGDDLRVGLLTRGRGDRLAVEGEVAAADGDHRLRLIERAGGRGVHRHPAGERAAEGIAKGRCRERQAGGGEGGVEGAGRLVVAAADDGDAGGHLDLPFLHGEAPLLVGGHEPRLADREALDLQVLSLGVDAGVGSLHGAAEIDAAGELPLEQTVHLRRQEVAEAVGRPLHGVDGEGDGLDGHGLARRRQRHPAGDHHGAALAGELQAHVVHRPRVERQGSRGPESARVMGATASWRSSERRRV